MKKLLIILLCCVGVAVCVVAVVLSGVFANNNKISNEFVKFEPINNATETFISNKDSSGEYIEYGLKIKTTGEEEFGSSILLSSNNVVFNSTIAKKEITVNFTITDSTTFYFSLQSENYETATKTYSATPYVQKEDISLEFSNAILKSYDMPTENGKYVLYVSQEEYYEQAYEKMHACQVYFSVLVNSGAKNVFDFQLSGDDSINLDSKNQILTGKSDGYCNLIIYATDGSGASKDFGFIVKELKVQQENNLPIEENNAEFNFVLGETIYSEKIVFNSENLTINLRASDFVGVENDTISVVLNVSLLNIESPRFVFDIYPNIEDFKKIVAEVNIGVGGNSVVPITIILKKLAGTVVVKFTNNAYGIESDLTIIVS